MALYKTKEVLVPSLREKGNDDYVHVCSHTCTYRIMGLQLPLWIGSLQKGVHALV